MIITVVSFDSHKSYAAVDVTLNGTGDVPNISVSPTILNFEAIRVRRSSTPLVVTISNTGTSDLHISDMLLSDAVNYSLDVNDGINPCGSTSPTLTPNNSCTVTITFNPTQTSELDGSLSINSDDPAAPTVNVSLTGRGTLPRCGCELYPDSTVVPRGGTLGFRVDVTNYTIGTWIFWVATKVTMPNGHWYPGSGYLVGPVKVTLTYRQSKSKHISHVIPYTAPLGTYTYHGYLGIPGAIWDECSFNFEVTE